MGEVISIYISKWFKEEGFDVLFERYCASKKLSRSKVILDIVAGFLDENRNYVDMKITDFEQKQIEEIKKEIPLGCEECGSEEIDIVTGLRVHNKGCSWLEARRKALESLGDSDAV